MSRVVVPDRCVIRHGVAIGSDIDRATIVGRTPKPWYLKLNPFWWFLNDDEQRVEDAPWYHGDWPNWLRVVFWNLRNPLQNFRAYVVGVADRNYEVYGRSPVLAVQRNDLDPPEYGWQWCVIVLQSGLRLFFVSYSGRHVVWYFGHQPSGFFGAKFNLHSG